MNPLHDIIAEEIRTGGPMSVSRFMELCLYHPEYGYYEREDREIGKEGDFYTSVSVGTVFGEMLAWQFAKWLHDELQPPHLLIEAGAHDGRLAGDILAYLTAFEPDLVSSLTYRIIEPSPKRRKRQESALAKYREKIEWIDDIDQMGSGSVNGIIFSNELLDAFPVDQVTKDATTKSWHELRVVENNGRFERVRGPETDPFAAPLRAVNGSYADDFTMELRNASFRWRSQAARALRSGRLLTLDYGLEVEEYTSPERREGTLRGYRNHQLVDDIFANVGEQDLTAHIDLTELRNIGEHHGLQSEQAFSQGRWLTRVLGNIHKDSTSFPDWTPKRLRQFQTLTHPDHLGEKFRVLIQHKLEEYR